MKSGTEELLALAAEARRRGITYGRFVASTYAYEREEIVKKYKKEKMQMGKRKPR